MSEQADKLMAWGMIFRLDGDLCRCKGCGRGIHICNRDQEFLHSSDCDFRSEEFPWKELDEALDSPIRQSVRRLVGEMQDLEEETRPDGCMADLPVNDCLKIALKKFLKAHPELSALIDGKGEGE